MIMHSITNNTPRRKRRVSLQIVGRMMRLDGLKLCEIPYHPEIVMGWLLEDLDAEAAIQESDSKPLLGDDPDHVAWLEDIGFGSESGIWI